MKMRRIVALFLTIITLVSTFNTKVVKAVEIPELETPSYVLMEASTGQVICSENADEPLHPASVTKIMTLLLIFEAIENKEIALTDEVTVSENAANMGGSQVFLEVGEVQTVDTMIKCISVASANDASVAMAEYIAGTEAAFVEKMNNKAKELGMSSANFVNCCGLDDDSHKMSAMDVAIMSRELINKYPQIHDYSTIWMDTITHNTKRGSEEFGLSNTNKLIKQYIYATGLKTGSTSKAKSCLSATAKKDNIELIAVVMAAPNSKTRFSDAITLLNYGFSKCNIYENTKPIKGGRVEVKNSMKSSIACEYRENFRYLFLSAFDESKIVIEEEYRKNLKAPIKKGECVGQAVYKYDGVVLGQVDIVAKEDVKKSTMKEYFGELFGGFFENN